MFANKTYTGKEICSNNDIEFILNGCKQDIKTYYDNFNLTNVVSLSQLGNISYNGFLHLLKLKKENNTLNILLKSNKEINNDNIFYEWYVGYKYINKLLNKYPCFVETYDLIKYNNISKINNNRWSHKVILNNAIQNINILKKHLAAENIVILQDVNINNIADDSMQNPLSYGFLLQNIENNITLYNYIMNNVNNYSYIVELLFILLQVYIPLTALKDVYTHNDLKTDNILLCKLPNNSYINMEYIYNGKKYTFKTPYIVKIIDYARSYFHDEGTLYNSLELIFSKFPDKKILFNSMKMIDIDAKEYILPKKMNIYKELYNFFHGIISVYMKYNMESIKIYIYDYENNQTKRNPDNNASKNNKNDENNKNNKYQFAEKYGLLKGLKFNYINSIMTEDKDLISIISIIWNFIKLIIYFIENINMEILNILTLINYDILTTQYKLIKELYNEIKIISNFIIDYNILFKILNIIVSLYDLINLDLLLALNEEDKINKFYKLYNSVEMHIDKKNIIYIIFSTKVISLYNIIGILNINKQNDINFINSVNIMLKNINFLNENVNKTTFLLDEVNKLGNLNINKIMLNRPSNIFKNIYDYVNLDKTETIENLKSIEKKCVSSWQFFNDYLNCDNCYFRMTKNKNPRHERLSSYRWFQEARPKTYFISSIDGNISKDIWLFDTIGRNERYFNFMYNRISGNKGKNAKKNIKSLRTNEKNNMKNNSGKNTLKKQNNNSTNNLTKKNNNNDYNNDYNNEKYNRCKDIFSMLINEFIFKKTHDIGNNSYNNKNIHTITKHYMMGLYNSNENFNIQTLTDSLCELYDIENEFIRKKNDEYIRENAYTNCGTITVNADNFNENFTYVKI